MAFGVAGAVALYVGSTLPPAAVRLDGGGAGTDAVFGAFHVHSNRSDGTGTPDDIAAAAARAGLAFVILTDHGDATRAPDPPEYRRGVLMIDALEVGSSAGHVIALGLREPSPYPLGGEGRDVVEDLHRLGGWVVVAHPDSPKPELRWRGASLPYEGIEWLNLDSEWRDETTGRLLGTLLRYPIRPPQVIASLIRRPVQTLRRWDMLARTRPVVGLAALDAHARVPWRDRGDPAANRTLVAMPGYVQMFRTVAQAVVPDRPLTGDGAGDAALVLGALRAGRAYSTVSAFAAPGRLTFTATADGRARAMGESAGPAGSLASFRAQVNDPTARVVLVHNGADLASGFGRVELTTTVTAGPYRVEAYRPGSPMPWIVSSPIYGGEFAPLAASRAPDTDHPAPLRLVPLPASGGWTIEKNDSSTASAGTEGAATRFTFTLGPGPAFNQFAALVSNIDEAQAQEGFDRVQLTVRADRPMRFSIQLRLPGQGDQRWRYSVYADATPRAVVAHLQDFQPVGRDTSHRPIVAHLRSVLFVIDTLNARPSTRGTLWLSDVALGVGRTER